MNFENLKPQVEIIVQSQLERDQNFKKYASYYLNL